MIENKPCKAIGKAKGFEGCGKKVKAQTRTYGLCRDCFKVWATSTEEGLQYLRKRVIPKAKREVEQKQKKEWNKRKALIKADLMSPDKFRGKYVQPIINHIARLIDHGQPCIATGNFGKMAGGHYISVGANRTIALNLHNIHIQTYQSNGPQGGDNVKYRDGLIDIYGNEYFEFVDSLRQCEPIKLDIEELREVKRTATKIRDDLKANCKVRTPSERIKLRDQVNWELAIYPEKFCKFIEQ